VQTVVCLAAVPEGERREFVERLLIPLRKLREATGRPHRILLDEARDIPPGSAQADDALGIAAENTIHVSADPAALAPAILAAVHGIVACGERAGASVDAVGCA